ncbi:MAG: hypothetical protein PHN38_04145 [Sulfurospirillaceae bacterium]|nr:hypothetical protein [Sulfurospirillaceae bacterium]
MTTVTQTLIAQKLLLDIQCASQFASKNINEDFIQKNVVTDLYSLIEKLHLSIKNIELQNISAPKSRA